MGTIKDRNGKDLTEAEDIKKRWQKYPEEDDVGGGDEVVGGVVIFELGIVGVKDAVEERQGPQP